MKLSLAVLVLLVVLTTTANGFALQKDTPKVTEQITDLKNGQISQNIGTFKENVDKNRRGLFDGGSILGAAISAAMNSFKIVGDAADGIKSLFNPPSKTTPAPVTAPDVSNESASDTTGEDSSSNEDSSDTAEKSSEEDKSGEKSEEDTSDEEHEDDSSGEKHEDDTSGEEHEKDISGKDHEEDTSAE